MNDFEYKVSVIVPVYNVEEFLAACLDSLMCQTIDKKNLEVLLINDGSTDKSLEICLSYASIYPCIKVFTKENEGVAATRNFGIQKARGKFIFYLDGDDELTPNTIEKVSEYFEDVYDDVDLVTYKIVPYKKKVAQPLHFRYRYLDKTGIYDLQQFPYAIQSTMNIVVKNNKQIFFDESLKQGEDQKYITENLLQKLKIGYCNLGEYKYIKHDSSAVSMQAYSYFLFEQRMRLWEDLFGRYQDEVPTYIQSLLMSNYLWELSSDCIFPYHYDKEDYIHAIGRIKNILKKVDVETILSFPNMDTFHKHFWISMKENANVAVLCDLKGISIYSENKRIYQRNNVEIILNKIRVEHKKLYLLAFVKSPVFNYIEEKPQVIVVENGSTQKRKLPVFLSINSHYKTKAHTNNFYGFSYECDVEEIDNFYFEVEIEGIVYTTNYYCMPISGFNNTLGVKSYIRENTCMTLEDNVIYLTNLSKEQIIQHQNKQVINNSSLKVNQLRNNVIYNPKRGKVWLYNDGVSVRKDNGYYQFIHDFGYQDGIDRWYVYTGEREEIEDLFTEQQKPYMVKYGSDLHKILYLCAEYIITSFSDLRPMVPFASDAEFSYFRDLFTAKIIYLQHGVLHADLRFTQSAERGRVDKVVISSYFEQQNYCQNYHYREIDLIPVGMPRYDYIDKSKKAKNKILFAPSWRIYLLGRGNGAKWEGNTRRVIESDYYKKFTAMLNSERLHALLEKYDLYLDAKLHQNMASTEGLFQDFEGKRVKLVFDDVEIEDYKLFITDFSSYVFDYAYLNRPVIYFVPDMEQFKSGMNHYRKLDLPFEKAFGNLVLDPEDAIDEIERIISRNFIPDPIFSDRMNDFYLPLENCSEKLYQYLIKESSNYDSEYHHSNL